MNTNGDDRIDGYDTDGNFAQKINDALYKQGSKYFVKYVKDVYSDAGIFEGSGGVVFRDKNDNFIEFRIDNQ